MPKLMNLFKVLTGVETKEPGFFAKTGEWIKTNPFLFSVGIAVVGLGFGLVYLARNKQNKRKSKR